MKILKEKLLNYELAFVIKGSLSEEESNVVHEDIIKLIDSLDGRVTGVDVWGKRRLAYKIVNEVSGFYYFVNYQAIENVPKKVQEYLRSHESVLRFLNIENECI